MKRPNFLLASDERGKSQQFKLAALCYRYDILGDFLQEPAVLSPAWRKPASCRPWEPCPTREGCIQPPSSLSVAFSEALLFQGCLGINVAPYELPWDIFLLFSLWFSRPFHGKGQASQAFSVPQGNKLHLARRADLWQEAPPVPISSPPAPRGAGAPSSVSSRASGRAELPRLITLREV